MINTALFYLAPFALAAWGAWRLGYRARAVGLAWMVAGLAAMVPAVDLLPREGWALLGVCIWGGVATVHLEAAERGEISATIPLMGYAMAGGYGLHFAGLPAFMVTSFLNGLGVLLLICLSGPPAHDAFRRLLRLLARALHCGVRGDVGRAPGVACDEAKAG